MGVISNGTTLLDAGALDSGVATGAMTLLTTITLSGQANATFSSSINSTYGSYEFHFSDIHPASESSDAHLCVNFRDGSTAYDATKTATYFGTTHSEADSTDLSYSSNHDLAQGTGVAKISSDLGADNDQAASGVLKLFNPIIPFSESITPNSVLVPPMSIPITFICFHLNSSKE